MQLLSHQLGGSVVPATEREYGFAVVHKNDSSPLFDGLDGETAVWMSHGDRISTMPPGFRAVAYTENSPIAAMANDAGMYGIQFHPEVAHTPQGVEIIRNFAYKVCGASGSWTPGHFVAETVQRIRDQVGEGRVICALSGGVDSAVTARLVHEAIGDQLTCIFVNNGLLRREEPERVRAVFERNLGLNLVYVDATERFLSALADVTDPEQKRKTIGAEFINVFEEEARTMGAVDFLAQGTLYPDVIESETAEHSASHKIKTHHNVGGLPERMQLDLVEPLRYLFKDEVRLVGAELGLPPEMINRQPFPRPRPCDPHHRRRHVRQTGDAARRGLDRDGRDQGRRPVRPALAELRRPHRHTHGGRDGRPAHVPARRGAPGGHERRRDDGGLGAPALRDARADIEPHRQRGAEREPRRLRHHEQTARHHRVGVGAMGIVNLRRAVRTVFGALGFTFIIGGLAMGIAGEWDVPTVFISMGVGIVCLIIAIVMLRQPRDRA